MLLAALAAVHVTWRQNQDRSRIVSSRYLVKTIGLTDLCLFTDARYSRHPSQADTHTPFQDYPLSFEHFPSASLILPPPHLRRHALD